MERQSPKVAGITVAKVRRCEFDDAPSQTRKRELPKSAALDPVGVVKMIYHNVFLAAALIPKLRPSTPLDYRDHARAAASFM